MRIANGTRIPALRDQSLRITADSADIHNIHKVFRTHGRDVKGGWVGQALGDTASGLRIRLNVFCIDPAFIRTSQDAALVLSADPSCPVLRRDLSFKPAA